MTSSRWFIAGFLLLLVSLGGRQLSAACNAYGNEWVHSTGPNDNIKLILETPGSIGGGGLPEGNATLVLVRMIGGKKLSINCKVPYQLTDIAAKNKCRYLLKGVTGTLGTDAVNYHVVAYFVSSSSGPTASKYVVISLTKGASSYPVAYPEPSCGCCVQTQCCCRYVMNGCCRMERRCCCCHVRRCCRCPVDLDLWPETMESPTTNPCDPDDEILTVGAIIDP
jgi:hypothetical protein